MINILQCKCITCKSLNTCNCSVLSRSPSSLLTEIILVDDFSDNGESNVIINLMETVLIVEDGELLTLIPKVKLIRLDERQGRWVGKYR